MHFRQLDLNLLVALDALLCERSITEAGRRLHVTQSAMSGSLARLRDYFRDELLVQVGRKMVLTPLAESLTEPVREILLKIKVTVDSRPDFEPATSSRRFSLMMSDYVSTVLMGDVLRRLTATAPGISFEIVSNDITHHTDALERSDVDLLVMPAAFLSKDHPSKTLFSDDFTCLVWAENSIVGDHLTVDSYLRMGHVCAQLGRGGTPMIDEWFLSRQDINRKVEVLAMNFNSVAQMLVGTNRVATVHRRLANYYCKYLPLRLLPCPIDIPKITEAVQWHARFSDDAGIAWLCSILRTVADQVAPEERSSHPASGSTAARDRAA